MNKLDKKLEKIVEKAITNNSVQTDATFVIEKAVSQIKQSILKAIWEKKRVKSTIVGAYRVEVPYVLFSDVEEVLK